MSARLFPSLAESQRRGDPRQRAFETFRHEHPIHEQSVELVDRSGDAFHRVGRGTAWANALHQAGR